MGYKKNKFSENELDKKLFLEDELEKPRKDSYNTPLSDSSQTNCLLEQEKDEVELKQVCRKKYFLMDSRNVDEILNNTNYDYGNKNIKLAQYLIEINNLATKVNNEELKILMQIQAKILESMITLTKQSQNDTVKMII